MRMHSRRNYALHRKPPAPYPARGLDLTNNNTLFVSDSAIPPTSTGVFVFSIWVYLVSSYNGFPVFTLQSDAPSSALARFADFSFGASMFVGSGSQLITFGQSGFIPKNQWMHYVVSADMPNQTFSAR